MRIILVNWTLNYDEGTADHYFSILNYKGRVLEEQTFKDKKKSQKGIEGIIISGRPPLCGDPEVQSSVVPRTLVLINSLHEHSQWWPI